MQAPDFTRACKIGALCHERIMNMVNYENILDIYDRASAKSGEMLEAAKSSDWDRLIDLERECRALVDNLRTVDAETSAPSRDQGYVQRKTKLIRKVLADDAEIRRYTQPWMDQLQVLIGSSHQEQRLQRAYQGV